MPEPVPVPETLTYGTLFEIQLEPRRFQWVKLLSSTGEIVILGDRNGLRGELLPGAYQLAFKRVGQTTTAAPFTLGNEATTWHCAPSDGGRTAC